MLDTAGQEEYSAMREQYMRKGDGFMIVYSVTDPQSFDNVPYFYNQILRVKDRWVTYIYPFTKNCCPFLPHESSVFTFGSDSCPMLLVANKVDLVHMRRITEEQGKEMAGRFGLRYMETSAKDPPLNVDAAFHEVRAFLSRFLNHSRQ